MAATAWAGLKSTRQVIVSTTGMYAYGSLANARSASGSVEKIGWFVETDVVLGTSRARCSATTAASVSATCTTYNAAFINTLNGLNGDSVLWFNWDAGANCTYVNVENQSMYAPKAL
jgi:hypothetical protein